MVKKRVRQFGSSSVVLENKGYYPTTPVAIITRGHGSFIVDLPTVQIVDGRLPTHDKYGILQP